jgi:hypothetical protein
MLIGIIGKSESGKSTLADFIEEIKPEYFTKSFKEPLADMMRALHMPIDTQEQKKLVTNVVATAEHIKAKLDMFGGYLTRRGVAQHTAMFFRNHIDPDFFVKAAMKDINKDHDVIFDDVRFQNEVHYIKQMGGIIIRVNRFKGDPGNVHVSESHDLIFDYQVDNVGTEKDLFDWTQVFCMTKLIKG